MVSVRDRGGELAEKLQQRNSACSTTGEFGGINQRVAGG